MKKRIMTVLVPIVLIFLVIAVALGSQILERFTYSKNQADLNEYFHLAQADEVAMVVQDAMVDESVSSGRRGLFCALDSRDVFYGSFLC